MGFFGSTGLSGLPVIVGDGVGVAVGVAVGVGVQVWVQVGTGGSDVVYVTL